MDLKQKSSSVTHFLSRGLWRIDLSREPRPKAFILRYCRIVLATASGYVQNNCTLRATALTFWTLLSFVPLLAMAFGIAKGFGLETMLEKRLIEQIPGQEAVLLQAVSFARSLLANTRGGLVAGFGVVLLLWSVLKVLANIETAFNHIWQVRRARTIVRKISDYLTLMIVCPLLFVISGSVTVYITTMVTEITEKIALLGMINQFIFMALKLLPYGLIWLLFSLLYLVMPNTKVRLSSAVLAGFVAGTGYQIAQWLYIFFQVGVARYNAIYGSFAALPLFLIWLQLSWAIVLVGTEFSYTHQHSDRLYLSHDCDHLSRAFRHVVILRVLFEIVRAFENQRPPFTAGQLSNRLKLPILLVQQVLSSLKDCQILSPVITAKNTDTAYQPALDIHQLTIGRVIGSLDTCGSGDIPLPDAAQYDRISTLMNEMTTASLSSTANLAVKDLPLETSTRDTKE